ncbi:MAG TPA: AraC family transcriptional regulator [Polyangiaceae bacterium]|nr:AraC family transcriptional regulator [Polyangiaceae bacterium]
MATQSSSTPRALFEHVEHDRDLKIVFRDVVGRALKYPFHVHPEIELTHIVRGSGLRYVGDSIQPFGDDDLCLIGPMTPHCWLSEGARLEPIHARVIQFLPESVCGERGSSAAFRPLQQLFQRAGAGLRLRGETQRRAAAQMRALFTDPGRPLDRYLGLLSLLTDLSRTEEWDELALNQDSVSVDTASAETVNRLLALIHEHAADPALSFGDLARHVGMSRATLGRAFPRLFGKTFVKYLSEVRILKACTLLSETDRSVCDIALSTGFGSLSNFNRQFRTLKGTTPLRYRQFAARRSVARG